MRVVPNLNIIYKFVFQTSFVCYALRFIFCKIFVLFLLERVPPSLFLHNLSCNSHDNSPTISLLQLNAEYRINSSYPLKFFDPCGEVRLDVNTSSSKEIVASSNKITCGS